MKEIHINILKYLGKKEEGCYARIISRVINEEENLVCQEIERLIDIGYVDYTNEIYNRTLGSKEVDAIQSVVQISKKGKKYIK